MPSIKTIEREIAEFEGFEVQIEPNTRDAVPKRIPAYAERYERIARNNFSVGDWIRTRFEPVYPGFAVKVLRADRKAATTSSRLSKIRATYFD